MIKEQFLPPYYEQTLFSRYQHCRQAYRTVQEYVIEFHKLGARIDIRESENQKISRFINGLRPNIHDEVYKQSHITLSNAIQLALRIETQLNKRRSRNPPPLPTSAPPTQRTEVHRGKVAIQYGETPKMSQSHSQPVVRPQRVPATNQASTSNPYIVLRGDKCYRCGQIGYHSNQCQQNRPINFTTHEEYAEGVEDYLKEEEYINGVNLKEITYEDEGVSLVIRRLIYAPKKEEDTQRHNIFKTKCTISQRVCDLIIKSGSSENIISKTIVSKVQLPTQPHPSPY